MTDDRYKLSFTALSLGLAESLTVAGVYLELADWEATKARVKGENLLQARTQTSIKRVYQELEPRLQTLSIEQMRFLVQEAGIPEQKQLLWYMLCKRYALIREFAVEVLCQRHRMLQTSLEEYDYTVFYNNKAEWRPELRQLKESTQTKIRTVLFRMLREADLLSHDFRIIPCLLSQGVLNQIAADRAWSFEIYPMAPPLWTGGADEF